MVFLQVNDRYLYTEVLCVENTKTKMFSDSQNSLKKYVQLIRGSNV